MATVTVSDKGQVVIPISIRKKLGIKPGCKLNFTVEGEVIRAEIQRPNTQTSIEEGFGMVVCPPGETRRLSDFDVAQAMQRDNDWT